jgi:hypothetical protein
VPWKITKDGFTLQTGLGLMVSSISIILETENRIV